MATKKNETKEEFDVDIFKNILVSNARILTIEEAQEILKKYNISPTQLPRILMKDPVCKKLGAQVGNIIEIERKTETAGLSKYYRIVIGG